MPSQIQGVSHTSEQIVALKDGHQIALYSIVKQNLLVLGSEWAGFFTVGFVTLLQVAWNGFQAGLLFRHYDLQMLAALVLPHAAFEFPALLIGATMILWLIVKTLQDLVNSEFNLIHNLFRVVPYACLCVGLILLAGMIEVYITPAIGVYVLGL